LGIAYRRLIDLLRKLPKQTDELNGEIIGPEGPEGPERSAALRQCMEKLKGSHRQLLVLAYEHELPGREIAEIMDIPVGTVKSALHTAKGLVKKCLERLAKKCLERLEVMTR